MSEDRLDIKVTDKIDSGVVNKLDQIADTADRAGDYIGRLQKALSSVNDTALARLANAMAKVDSAQARLISAQARLTNAQNAGSVAASKVALANQKIATEAQRTSAAQQRAAAATSAAEGAALRLATAQQRVTGASSAAVSGTTALVGATNAGGSAFERAGVSIRAYVASLNTIPTAATGVAGANQRMAAGMDMGTQAANRAARAGRMTTHTNANIIAQLNDIGVSLAGGQNPLLVMIQQGSQLSYIASIMEGGVKALTMTIIGMLVPFTPIIAAIAALYGWFKKFTTDMGTEFNPTLKEYAKSLGLTDKEMKKLGNSSVGANGKLKEFDQAVITSGDTWNGFKATVAEGFAGLMDGWGPVGQFFESVWDKAMTFLGYAFLGFYGLVVGGMRAVAKTIMNLPSVVSNTVKAMANFAIMGIEFMINKGIDGINTLAASAQSAFAFFGIEVGRLDHVKLDRLERTGQSIGELFGTEVTGAVQEADRTLKGFQTRMKSNTLDAAMTRIGGLADAIKGDRTPGAQKKDKAEPKGKERVDLLAQINRGLDDELKNMKLLKDERVIAEKMSKFEEQLLRAKIKLSEEDRLVLVNKVKAIEEYKYVQSESDRIMEDAIGPQRTLNAVMVAANKLLDDGKISMQQYFEQVRMAERAFAEATDPLFAMNEALESAENITGKYGVALEQAIYLEQIRQAMLAKGAGLSDEETSRIKDQVKAMVERNDALRQKQFIDSQIAGFVDPAMEQQRFLDNYKTIYAEMQTLRDTDLANEGMYQQAMYGLQAKYNEMRLSGISDMFGAIASVSAKGHGVIGAISKGAAMAQATMDGFVAVQKALASLPPPFNFAAAAAVAIQTGVQVAGIASTNVGSFATGGQFMVDGKSGVDANNINMNVTKGERVSIETPAQQRANDSSDGTVVDARTKVVNMFDETSFIGAMDSEEGERVVMNIIRRNPDGVNGLLGRG